MASTFLSLPITPLSGNFTDLTDTPGTYSGQAAKVLQVNATETAVEFITSALTDEKIKISANDTTADFLGNKVTSANAKLVIAEINDGLNEDLQFTLDETAIDHDNLTNAGGNQHIDWTSASDNFVTSGSLTVTGAVSLNNAVTINEAGADVDFRVEGDTEQNLLFCDASTDRVGIGTSTPACELHLYTASGSICQRIESDDAASGIMQLQLYNDSNKELTLGKLGTSVNFFGAGSGAILNRDGNMNIICDSDDPIIFYTDSGDTQDLSATEKARITPEGSMQLTLDSQAFYFGPVETDGSWRIIRSGDDLEFQRRESGTYIKKGAIIA